MTNEFDYKKYIEKNPLLEDIDDSFMVRDNDLEDTEGVGYPTDHWLAYIKSLVNDIEKNGVDQYSDFSEDDFEEDFENYIQEKF